MMTMAWTAASPLAFPPDSAPAAAPTATLADVVTLVAAVVPVPLSPSPGSPGRDDPEPYNGGMPLFCMRLYQALHSAARCPNSW